MLQFTDFLRTHKKAKGPVTIRFFIGVDNNSVQELNIVPVVYGNEIEVLRYVEEYVIDIVDKADEISPRPAWIFLIQNKQQIKSITPHDKCSFVVRENDKLVFYEGH